MINASELRIGNLVQQLNRDDNGYTTKVIDPMDIVGQHQCDIVSRLWLEGIPITEQWLLRGGFVKKHNSGRSDDLMYWDRVDISLFINYDDSINLGCELSEYEDCVPLNDRKIEYVHQLQNLYYALTGQELEFKENI